MWSNPQPSAPPLADVVGIAATDENNIIAYGNEEGCDVVFLVGSDDQPWRLPAIKRVIQDATPVFRAMFSDHFAPQHSPTPHHPHTIRVTDVEGRAFDNLLRFVYGEIVTFQSVETALPTLFAAHKYICPGLVQHCIDYLSRSVSISNVLQILSCVPLLCGNVQNLENWNKERAMRTHEDSEIPFNSHEDRGEPGNLGNYSHQPSIQRGSSFSSDCMESACATLLDTCLHFVDEEATAILSSDEVEDVDYETIRLILFRDTLDVSDENVVFIAILKWADKECKRQQKQLTGESKRAVLGELLFLPRYLLMSLHTFLHCNSGPAKSSLFTPDEVKCLTTILKKRIKVADFSSPDSSPAKSSPAAPFPLEIPSTLRPYYRTMAKPRTPSQASGGTRGSPKKHSKRGWNLIELLRSRRCCCTSARRIRQQSHKNSSQAPSPANSNPSSPFRCSSSSRNHQQQRAPEQHKRWNTAVEKCIVFLACLFD